MLTEKEKELAISREDLLRRWRKRGRTRDVSAHGTGRGSREQRQVRKYTALKESKPKALQDFITDLYMTKDLDVAKEAYVRYAVLQGKKKPEEVSDTRNEFEAVKLAFQKRKQMAKKEAVAAMEQGLVPPGIKEPTLPDLEVYFNQQADKRHKELAIEVYNRAEKRMEDEYSKIDSGNWKEIYDPVTEDNHIDTSKADVEADTLNDVVDLLSDMHIPVPSDKAIEHLKLREGFREAVYEDTTKNPTVGWGHKLSAEEKKMYSVGSAPDREQIDQWWEDDTRKAHEAAIRQAKELGDPRLVDSLFAVNYQLGTSWNKVHKETWKLLQKGQYSDAAEEAARSKWNDQTPTRVADFQSSLRELGNQGLTIDPTKDYTK